MFILKFWVRPQFTFELKIPNSLIVNIMEALAVEKE